LTTHAGNASVATTIQLIDTAVAPRARAAAAQFSGRVDAARVRHGRQRRSRPAQRGRDDRAAATRPAPRADRPRPCAAGGDGGADPPALPLKRGISIINTPCTIDSDYRGEIRIPLINFDREPQEIAHGERIAQMLIAQVIRIEWELADELPPTGRGSGGFGSTGRH